MLKNLLVGFILISTAAQANNGLSVSSLAKDYDIVCSDAHKELVKYRLNNDDKMEFLITKLNRYASTADNLYRYENQRNVRVDDTENKVKFGMVSFLKLNLDRAVEKNDVEQALQLVTRIFPGRSKEPIVRYEIPARFREGLTGEMDVDCEARYRH